MEDSIEEILKETNSKLLELEVAKGHCWFGHKWSVWSEPDRLISAASIMTGISINMQSRFCIRCRKVQRRYF